VNVLREAGAAQLHLRIVSPPIRWPCFYGIDMSTRGELIAAGNRVEEIRAFIGADSLAYLSLDGLVASTGAPRNAFCRACFDGQYPVPVGAAEPSKFALETTGS
jgi:amidophosphoribosyltransferase